MKLNGANEAELFFILLIFLRIYTQSLVYSFIIEREGRIVVYAVCA